MAFFNILAVTASSFLLARLGAVTSTMARHIAVNTLDLDTINLGALFLASFKGMTHFCISRVWMSVSCRIVDMPRTLTIAVGALGDLPIKWESGICETFEVFLRGRRPAVLEIGTMWLVVEVKTNYVLATKLSLQVNKAVAASDLFLLLFSPTVTITLV